MTKKKISIIIICSILVLILSFTGLFNNNIDLNKLKGDISNVTASASIMCNASSLTVGETTNCELHGNVNNLNGSIVALSGQVTGTNFSIESVTKSSAFDIGIDGEDINYIVTPGSNLNNSFKIADIVVRATSSGQGTVNFINGSFCTNIEEYLNINAVSSSVIQINDAYVPSDNNYLSNLKVNNESIGFNKDNLDYSYNVGYSTTSVSITATKEALNAHDPVISGPYNNLQVGSNDITITVTAENGSQRTYNLNIIRASKTKSNDATLKSLSVSNADIGVFTPSNKNYSATVDSSVKEVVIMAEANSSEARVSGDLGTKKVFDNLNKYVITVTAENGTVNKYVISITRTKSSGKTDKSSINTLSSLKITNATLTPEFKSGVNSYTATVAKTETQITIAATPTDSKAKVSGDLGVIKLTSNTKSYNVIVTAEDGSTNVYKIVVVREEKKNNNEEKNTTTNTTTGNKDNNSLLDELKINKKNITLDDFTFAYKFTVLYKVSELDIKATPKSKKSTVNIVGGDDLKVGKNLVYIKVEAEDGSSTTYIITVTRKEEGEVLDDDATLASLKIEKYNLKFSPTTYTYDLKIKNDKELDIAYEATNTNSNVIISGNYDLDDGSVVNLIVTAEDGSIAKYTINIKKGGNLLKIILFILLGLIILAGIGFGIFMLIKKTKKVKVSEPEEITSFSDDIFNDSTNNMQNTIENSNIIQNQDINNQNFNNQV